MPKLNLEKVPSFYHNYIKLVTEEYLHKAFNNHPKDLVLFLKELPVEKWDFKYADGKWTIKEMIQHLIDAERIFGYRALTFARKDNKILPGFEENLYVESSKAGRRNPEALKEELKLVQMSSAMLFESFDEEQLHSEGVANNKNISVEAIGYIIIGHCRHHMNIIKERYL